MARTNKKHPELMPTYDKLMEAVFQALVELGDSGTIEEINQKVFEQVKLPDEILEIPHGENGSQSEVEYRLAWARTYLKKYGLLTNSERGVWALTPAGKKTKEIDSDLIVRKVREADAKKKGKTGPVDLTSNPEVVTQDVPAEIQDWKNELRKILLKMPPSSFEKLAQWVLRESGFSQVEVTGKSGDQGIDGKGILRINGFLSFHVYFQCKRYTNAVQPSEMRDFRGTMVGRADKGIFITTSHFTKGAIVEATRDGASPIDLIDGETLMEKLKELNLGIRRELVEKVVIDEEWFKAI